jgi:glucose dehydrogenase
MYFGVGNPAPFPGTAKYPWGSSRPGRNLYTNSLVKLDAATGKMKWYYQLTPHDVHDWDLQDPPILTQVKGKDAVVTAGKAGIVIAVDRASGKLLWKTPVGKHNGHDNDGLYAMRRQYSKLKLPATVYPGVLGGVIAPMATDGKSVFVSVVDSPVKLTSQTGSQSGAGGSGEMVSVDLDTGKIKWVRYFPSPAFGAMTVVNDLVFSPTFDGRLVALDTASGGVVWRAGLPAGTNTGVTISGDTVIAPAGIATAQGQTPALVAYRLRAKAGKQ